MNKDHSTKGSDQQRVTTCMDDFDPDSLSIEQAVTSICNLITARDTSETLLLSQAFSRVLSGDLVAPIDVPSFRNSAMDGYAYRWTDDIADRPLRVVGTSLAGHPYQGQVQTNECIRIMTGALVPDNLDTVVMQENTAPAGGEKDHITITQFPESGDNVRDKGSNVTAGSRILKCGHSLDAAAVGLIASLGIERVSVRQKLKIGCFSTGDELCPPGTAARTGEIYDSNRLMLLALLADPRIEAIDLGIRRDSEQDLHECLADTQDLDMVISSGGVSVGDADFVRTVINEFGTVNLWKVAMKPGRPLTHATIHQNTHYFGLPGNPVSSIVTFHQFVRPALLAMLGQKSQAVIEVSAELTQPIRKRPGRVELQRGILQKSDEGDWLVTSTGQQDSHVLQSMASANCYIYLDVPSTGAEKGDLVQTLPFLNFRL